MSTDIKHPLDEGTRARVTRTVTENDFDVREGTVFTVDYFVSEQDAQDGTAFYTGSTAGGAGNVEVPADAVEVILSAEQMDARPLPTLQQVRKYLGTLAGRDSDTFEIDESDYSGSGSEVELYGETSEGVPFEIIVEVKRIARTDG